MKKSIRIAKLELSTLFYSPIAWLLLLVFFIQCAMTYTDSLESWLTYQELGGQYIEQLTFLTSKIFGYSGSGMAPVIAYNLYMYIPLLTMGLISREISSGTIKLLYSSPIKTRDIVFGKFFAICSYGLLLTLIFGIFLVIGTIHLEHADIRLLLSIMAGVFLLLSAYGAIGLFVSCLTSYQVVAAISTFIAFAFLTYIGGLWQDIDFVRDITYSLSLPGHIGNLGSGLVTTKDLCYFAVILYIFLGMSILKLQGTRSTDSGWKKLLKYVSLIISGIAIGYISARPLYTGYLDVTATKTHTLTVASQKILADMKDGPLEITSYINLLENNYVNGAPSQRNTDMERWIPYLRFKPDISFNYVYYYDSIPDPYFFFYKQYPDKSLSEIASIFAKSFRTKLSRFKKPEEIRRIVDLRPEQNRYVMQLKYNGKSTFLRTFDDGAFFPSERETGAALKRMLIKLPKIAFLEGELERSAYRAGEKDYKTMTSEITFRYSMINQGFDVTTVSLKNAEIPADISVLVIADPKAAFEPGVLARIEKYIDDGGNLLIAGEPGKQSIVNRLLNPLKVSMMDGMIVQPSDDFYPNLALMYMTDAPAAFSKFMKKLYADSSRISMQSATGLLYDSTGNFNVQPFLMTDERFTWRKIGALSPDSLKVSFTPADGDEKGKFPTMLGLSRKIPGGREQRIIVASDADFMCASELFRNLPPTVNFAFNTSLFGWLSNGEFPIDITRPDSRDRVIRLRGDDVPLLKLIFVWIIPFIILITGIILLVRRNKQ